MNKKYNKKKLLRIEGSLKYGRFFTSEMIVFYFIFIISIFIIIFAMNILSLVGGVLLLAISLAILIKNNKIKKRILLWLEDAIELKAYSQKVDSNYSIFPAVKIRVDFKVESKKHTKFSEGKTFGLEEGQHNIWAKYADREISILYSSKYDQVLILKDNNKNRAFLK